MCRCELTAEQVRSASECVRRSHCVARHSPTQNALVGRTRADSVHTARQTRQNSPVRVVSGVSWCEFERLLWTCSDFELSVGDGSELSGIHLTPPKRTRRRQESFVACLAWRCELALSPAVRRSRFLRLRRHPRPVHIRLLVQKLAKRNFIIELK